MSQVGATREEFPECMEIFHTLGELSPCVHVCCSVSLCGQELVRGEIRIFRHEIGCSPFYSRVGANFCIFHT